jgi:hypothetical protein
MHPTETELLTLSAFALWRRAVVASMGRANRISRSSAVFTSTNEVNGLTDVATRHCKLLMYSAVDVLLPHLQLRDAAHERRLCAQRDRAMGDRPFGVVLVVVVAARGAVLEVVGEWVFPVVVETVVLAAQLTSRATHLQGEVASWLQRATGNTLGSEGPRVL